MGPEAFLFLQLQRSVRHAINKSLNLSLRNSPPAGDDGYFEVFKLSEGVRIETLLYKVSHVLDGVHVRTLWRMPVQLHVVLHKKFLCYASSMC